MLGRNNSNSNRIITGYICNCETVCIKTRDLFDLSPEPDQLIVYFKSTLKRSDFSFCDASMATRTGKFKRIIRHKTK